QVDPIGLGRSGVLASELGRSLAAPWLGRAKLEPHRDLALPWLVQGEAPAALAALDRERVVLDLHVLDGPCGSANASTFPVPVRRPPEAGRLTVTRSPLSGL